MPPLSEVFHFGLAMPGVSDSVTCQRATNRENRGN